MKKKDIFWIIVTVTVIVVILGSVGLSYFYISNYSAIQNDFYAQYNALINTLDKARENKILPTKEWPEEASKINSELDSIFKDLVVGDDKNPSMLNALDTSNDIKHFQFFEKLKNINGFTKEIQLVQAVSKSEVEKMASSVKEWTDSMIKKEKELSNFENWLKKTVLKDGKRIEELQCEGREENREGESEFPFSMGNGKYQDVYKELYTDLPCSIVRVISKQNLSAESGQKEEELTEFYKDYNALIPSFLLAKYLVDKIPEFSKVNLKSIFISRWNPIALSKVIYFKKTGSGAKQLSSNLSDQISLCFCYKKPPPKYDPSYIFSCTQDGSLKFTVENTNPRFFDSVKQKESVDYIDAGKIQNLSSAMQFSIFPRELGTTIPLAFSFLSNYKNFYELLRALYRLNENRVIKVKNDEGREEAKQVNGIFEELGVKIPIPVVVSRVSFRLNENISANYFRFNRELEKFPKVGLDTAWIDEKNRQEKKLIDDLNEKINKNLQFFIEILIHLYDPQGFSECWKNIPVATQVTEQTTPTTGK